MEEFLKTVARHYLDKVCHEAEGSGQPLTLPFSRLLFCFPNHRSGLFFARYLQEVYNVRLAKASGSSSAASSGQQSVMPCCVPPMTTINELFNLFSSSCVIDRTTLLFRLFHVYNRLSKRHESFDQFVFWGDMLLSDFDDVDKYLVDAGQLFANVRDLKEIDARFDSLTEKQITVIRSFWQSFHPEKTYSEDDKHEVFGQTWAILSDLYHAFRRELSSHNEAYSGMLQREVVERLCASEADAPFADFPYDKVVFVGLTAISGVDRKFMSLLKLHGLAEFCWDYADPRLRPDSDKATSAAYFSKDNLADFANELTDEELQSGLVPETHRKVDLYSVASGVGQTRLARRVLQHWKAELGEGFNPLRTAVVLPDEKLLLPMLYAIPSGFDKCNVTMGYSLKNTPVTSFMKKLMELQLSWRSSDNSFYYRQVFGVLMHPFVHALTDGGSRGYYKKIVESNEYRVPASRFQSDGILSSIFRHEEGALPSLDYLGAILDLLMQRAAVVIQSADDVEPHQYEIDFESVAEGGADFSQYFGETDYEFFYHYRKTLTELRQQVQSGGIPFSAKTLFLLLDKLIAGVSVPFSGEPLEGLQVMGVLETRSLDFDNVMILSMNEGVFPAKSVQNTFVPMSLRDAFGMPTQRHRDSVFAYHFYRMISRASRLVMIYDSRTDGMQTGEESRYVKQLRYLMGHDHLEVQTISHDIGIAKAPGIVVNKTPEVMSKLNQCLVQGGTRYLSASVLKDYIKCPLKFYLGFVRKMKEDDEVSEGVDSALFGDILHEAMHLLYEGCRGKVVQASMLEDCIKNPALTIARCVREAFESKVGISTPDGYNLLIEGLIVNYITELLRHDVSLCPFTYLEGEQKFTHEYDAGNGLLVRLSCIFDRLDMTSVGSVVRIVDYKTGSSDTGKKRVFSSLDSLFSPDGPDQKEIFQVMMYCLLFEELASRHSFDFQLPQPLPPVTPHLYFVREFSAKDEVTTSVCEGTPTQNQAISDFAPYRVEFRDRLSRLLSEIFNPEIPFTQCQDVDVCEYCDFATLCNRKKE